MTLILSFYKRLFTLENNVFELIKFTYVFVRIVVHLERTKLEIALPIYNSNCSSLCKKRQQLEKFSIRLMLASIDIIDVPIDKTIPSWLMSIFDNRTRLYDALYSEMLRIKLRLIISMGNQT